MLNSLTLTSVLLLPLAPQQDAAVKIPKLPAHNEVIPAAEWRAVVDQGKQHSEVMDHLDHLTNRIGPRLTSSMNLQNACDWAVDYLKSLGYENAHLEKWGEFPVGFDRGPSFGAITKPASAAKPLVFVTRAWSAGTRGRQEGECIVEPQTLEAAKKIGAAMRGKWLVETERPRTRRRRGPLSKGVLELRRYCEAQGALGRIYSGSEIRRGTPHKNLLLTSGNRRIKWDSLPTFPAIQVRWDQFQELKKLIANGASPSLAFDIRNWFRKGPIPLYNVVAEITGTTTPEEFVVVSGHLDSWDGATGTTDNGTGSATTIEAARILKVAGVKPKRTIRFILWTGEEQGLLGSRAYTQRGRTDIKKNCQACLVHDGGTNYASAIRGSAAQLPLLLKAFAGMQTIDPELPFVVQEGDQPSYGSDHASFVGIRAPGFYWQQSGRASYRWTHHTQHDTYDAAVPEYQAQTATVAALGALALANLDERMPAPPPRSRRGRNFTGGVTFDAKLVVTKVEAGSMFAASGVKKGDKLVSLGGTKLAGRGDWGGALRDLFRSGGSGKLVVERDGQSKTLDVKMQPRRR